MRQATVREPPPYGTSYSMATTILYEGSPSYETSCITEVVTIDCTTTISKTTQTVPTTSILVTIYMPSLPSYVLTAPITTTTVPENACASIRELALDVSVTSPIATPTVPAALAYECINSVPFNQSAAGKYKFCTAAS